jgi:sulfur-oxidizing protein SoxX
MRSWADILVIVVTLSVPPAAGGVDIAGASSGSHQARLERGREIAFDRTKGNCLACHAIDGGTLPGNIGPPLMVMKQRFPERERLRAQIRDATASNPDSIMPPFGRHRILSDEEIELVVDFLYSL